MPGFYDTSVNLDARATPYGGKRTQTVLSTSNGKKLQITSVEGKSVVAPLSMMNENAAIDYRTIYNGFNVLQDENDTNDFTLYSDYKRCMTDNAALRNYLSDAKNPTIDNILKYYNGESNQFDPHGLARYKLEDFIYNKHYSQITNNYLLTLRRYTMPCQDHMFGLDLEPSLVNKLNGLPETYFAVATAITYMGEQCGQQLSDILKISYGQNYEDKQSQVESLQNPDGGGLAAQLQKHGVSKEFMSGVDPNWQNPRAALTFATGVMAKGKTVNEAIANTNSYEGDTYLDRFPDAIFGPINRIDSVTARSAGLTFSNDFTLTFEYNLSSLKFVNPKVAMLDILANFMLLTGNYGVFWGGMTRYYGNIPNIAPQFGNPELLRDGQFGDYLGTVWSDVKDGFNTLRKTDSGADKSIFETVLDVIKGGAEAMLGNLIGSNLGPESSAQLPKALLSGDPTGHWHLVVGNPLNPIAVIGNLCVENTEIEYGNSLGYDDFPTSVKFIVHLKHGRARDVADIQSMFNAGKGRIYQYTPDVSQAFAMDDANKNKFRHSAHGQSSANIGTGKTALEFTKSLAQSGANKAAASFRTAANAMNLNVSA